MKYTKLIIVVFSTLILASCNHECKEEGKSCDHNKKEEITSVVIKKNEESHSHSGKSELHLNNGEKWIANEATQVGMGAMQKILVEFTEMDEKNYAALVKDLTTETNLIINKCDMEGEDHEMLHLVLHPILETVEGIGTSETPNTEIENLNVLLSNYFRHFKTAE